MMVEVINALNSLTWPGAISFCAFCALLAFVAWLIWRA
jgi:cyanate permease